MRLLLISVLLLLVNISCYPNETDVFTNQNIEVSFPEIIVKDVQQTIDLRITDEEIANSFNNNVINVKLSGEIIAAVVKNGSITIPYTFDKKKY